MSPEQSEKVINRVPLKRMASASEIAEAAYFLAQSTYITGQVFTVDGGLSLNM